MDEIEAAAPNCPECLHRLEASGTGEHPYWECPGCGHIGIAV